LLSGNPGTFEVSVTGNIRRTSGTANGTFYFEVYHRDSGGTETLICTSDVTTEVSSATYVEFSAKAVWNNGDFSTTDRIVYKFYGSKVGGGSNPTFDFQFGGTNPVRSTVPVAATLLLEPIYEALDNKQDVLIATDYSTISTIVGFSTIDTNFLMIQDFNSFMIINYQISGTSNATNFTFSIPHAVPTQQFRSAYVRNNGTFVTSPALIQGSGTTVTIFNGTSTFTASGTKSAYGTIILFKS